MSSTNILSQVNVLRLDGRGRRVPGNRGARHSVSRGGQLAQPAHVIPPNLQRLVSQSQRTLQGAGGAVLRLHVQERERERERERRRRLFPGNRGAQHPLSRGGELAEPAHVRDPPAPPVYSTPTVGS